MSRVIFATTVAWAAALAGPAAAAEPGRKPNVVFVMADDLGWADLNPYGSTYHDTPNLQRLAGRAVRFTNYYTASPLCSPTRSSVMTGLYPARIGITAPSCHVAAVQLEKKLAPAGPKARVQIAESLTRLKGEYVTLAEVFRGAGYATAHYGKWHLGHGKGYEPRDQGFDADVPHTPAAPGPGGGYFAPWQFVKDAGFAGKPREHIDEWMADHAAGFIQAHKDRPFYLNFWMYSVHSPWNGDPALIEQYQKTADPAAGQRNPLYAAMIKRMDNAVGKLLDALDAAGVADDTVVVFTSDNGGWAYPPKATDPKGYESTPATSNAPLRSGKASLFEGGTRVPCLVAWPGKAKPGTVSDALFSSVDWFPTLLGMAGVTPPAATKLDGVDQRPAVLGGPSARDAVYVHFPHGSDAQEKNIPGFYPGTWVRKGDWKLIRLYAKNADGTDRFEVYDLKTDVGETKNLAAEKPAVVADLAGRIAAFLKDTEAVVPRATAAAVLPVREIDPSQAKWFQQYEKQPNVPKPADMLLNTDPEPTVGDGAVPLFNGKDLTGWKTRGGESKFDVRDGCIRAVCKPDSPSTYLCTVKDDYADFLLTFETRFVAETNTGIMVRAQAKGPTGNTVFGPQVEQEPYAQGRGWSGGIYGQDCGGWFYPVWLTDHAAARKAQSLKKADEWNRVTVLAKGDTIKTWLNGVPVAHWKTDEYKRGYFGLQMHKGKQGEVLWRDLKLQPLDAGRAGN